MDDKKKEEKKDDDTEVEHWLKRLTGILIGARALVLAVAAFGSLGLGILTSGLGTNEAKVEASYGAMREQIVVLRERMARVEYACGVVGMAAPGTIGHGAGTGTGQGFGAGAARPTPAPAAMAAPMPPDSTDSDALADMEEPLPEAAPAPSDLPEDLSELMQQRKH